MPFPNLEGKYAYDAFFTPQEAIAYLQRRGPWDQFRLPAGVVFIYSPALLQRILARGPAQPRGRFSGQMYLSPSGSGAVIGLCAGFGIGAPAVTTLMEELIA